MAGPTKIFPSLWHRFGWEKTTSPCNLLDLQRQPPLRALRGGTSLHWAAKNGHDSVVQRLLAAGAAVEAAANDGSGLGRVIFWLRRELVVEGLWICADPDSKSEVRLILLLARHIAAARDAYFSEPEHA